MTLRQEVAEAIASVRHLIRLLEIAAQRRGSTHADAARSPRGRPPSDADPADLARLIECCGIGLAEHLAAAATALTPAAAQTARGRQQRVLRAHALLRQRARSVRDPILRRTIDHIAGSLLRMRAS